MAECLVRADTPQGADKGSHFFTGNAVSLNLFRNLFGGAVHIKGDIRLFRKHRGIGNLRPLKVNPLLFYREGSRNLVSDNVDARI